MNDFSDRKHLSPGDPYAGPAIVLTFVSVLIGLIVTGGFEFESGHRGFENFSNWINDNLFLVSLIGVSLATLYALLPHLCRVMSRRRGTDTPSASSSPASTRSPLDAHARPADLERAGELEVTDRSVGCSGPSTQMWDHDVATNESASKSSQKRPASCVDSDERWWDADSAINDERDTAPNEGVRALEKFVAIRPAAVNDRSAGSDRNRSRHSD